MSIEKDAKKERRRYIFQQAVLTSLKLGVILGMAVLMPNAMKVIRMLGWVPTKRDPKYSLENAITKLERKELITIKNKDGKYFYKITKKGKLFLWKFESQIFKIRKPKKWDKRWRLIIFDILEKDRFQRDAIRVMLKNIGCVGLQNSVWVYPYDCEEVVTLLKANYEIGDEVLYIIAEKIENDLWLKKHFKLN